MLKRKLGLVIVILSGLVMAFILASLAQLLITEHNLAWKVFVSALTIGIALVSWGIFDLRTHKKDTCK